MIIGCIFVGVLNAGYDTRVPVIGIVRQQFARRTFFVSREPSHQM